MSKYIGTDKLIAEIEKRAKFHDDAMKACIGLNNIAITHSAGWKEDIELLAIIDSLQQEQPQIADASKMEKVELENEIERYCRIYYNFKYPDQIQNGRCSSVMPHIIEAARHFYKLGFNARKE